VNKPYERSQPAHLDQVKATVQSDLQYVSLQVDGRTYGGWYRTLADGRLELLALANMQCERREENSPIEQARGMLAEFIRAAQPTQQHSESPSGRESNGTPNSTEDAGGAPRQMLGDLLYADTTKARVPEQEWTRVIQSIAAGDQLGLYRLFERTHRLVFTLIMRLLDDVDRAEELTLDVFHDIWRQASKYEPTDGALVGWIMNQARTKALAELRSRIRSSDAVGLQSPAAAGAKQRTAQGSAVDAAISELTDHERRLLDALFFSELGREGSSLDAHPSDASVGGGGIQSGLEKLRHALGTAGQQR
jgi:RNA polymerase sigma-70 factor (ECF subfamily)